jgi:RNA polymerase sigma-70 factor (ECF subfamily)
MKSMEPTAFQELYEAHAAKVHGLARYLTGDEAAAADITAETFLRAWAGRDRIRAPTARAWLLAIARNLARDERRRTRRWPGGEVPETPVAPRAEAAIELERVLEAMNHLPLTYREPMAMVAIGVDHDEIAALLGLSRGAVKVRVYRARQQLAARLAAVRNGP